MSVSTSATNVPSTVEQVTTHASPRRLTELPALLDGAGAVAALRRRPTVPVGAMGSSDLTAGRRLVGARDVHDAPWWIPACAVWSDAEQSDRPERPVHVGLATDRSWSRAVLTGLSDRLAWEAKLAHGRGDTMAVVTGIGPAGPAVVLDGRVGHDVPTAHIVSDKIMRGAAGSTMESAYRRALFGDGGSSESDIARELADMHLVLADAGVHVAVVDMGTQLLRAAGVSRVSIQLMGR